MMMMTTKIKTTIMSSITTTPSATRTTAMMTMMLRRRWYNYNSNNAIVILHQQQQKQQQQHQQAAASLMSSLPTINDDDDDNDDNIEDKVVPPTVPLATNTNNIASSIGGRVRYQQLRDRLRQEQNQHYQSKPQPQPQQQEVGDQSTTPMSSPLLPLSYFASLSSSTSSSSVSMKPTITKTTKSSSITTPTTTSTSTSEAASTDNIKIILTDEQKHQRKVEHMIRRLEQLPDPPPPTASLPVIVSTTSSSLTSSVLNDPYNRQHTYLRISLIEKCNLRCIYCMPENGLSTLHKKEEILTTNELILLSEYFIKRGITKFRLTGGEPTLRTDIINIISSLSTLQKQYHVRPNIGITTNGITLYQNVEKMIHAGLTSINISLDTLNIETFIKLTRRPANYYHNVIKSIETSIRYRHLLSTPIKINVVLMRGINDNEIYDFIQLLLKYNATTNMNDDIIQIRFIEYMPFHDNGWSTNYFISYQEVIESIHTQYPNVQLIPSPSLDPNDTTKWYHVMIKDNDIPVKIGFITSMTNHFCGTCNRLRLTADGQMKVCLFDGSHDNDSDDNNDNDVINNNDNHMISLRDIIRYTPITVNTNISNESSTINIDHNTISSSDDTNNDNNITNSIPSNNIDNNNNNNNNNNNIIYRNLDKVIYHALQKKHYSLGGHKNAQHIHEQSHKNRPMTMIGG